MRTRVMIGATVVVLAAACGDSDGGDTGPIDSGTSDGGMDSAADSGGDTGTPVDTGPGTRTILYAADWDAETGTSTAALTDGNTMDTLGFPSDRLLETVSIAHLGLDGWPVNALEISFDAEANASVVGFREGEGHDTGWPAPEVGESIYFRMLLYNALPDDSGVASSHGMQSNIGPIAHGFQLFSPSGRQFNLGFFSLTDPAMMAADTGWYTTVPADAPLRIEWAFHREPGVANARLEIRVYDESASATTPLRVETDFRGDFGAGPATLSSDAVLGLGDNVGDAFSRYLFGTSGNSSMDTSPVYVTGFAVCSGDWCGPYVLGEGP